MQILHKAQQRQIEDLERKLDDSRRNMRYVEHQFAIVKGECHTPSTVKMRDRRCCSALCVVCLTLLRLELPKSCDLGG